MNHKEIIENGNDLGEPINNISWQEDLMRRIMNNLTMSKEMEEELSLDKWKMF